MTPEELEQWEVEATDYKLKRGSIHPGQWNDRILALCAEVRNLREVLNDKKRIVREFDVQLNGEKGAASKASLIDIFAQVSEQLAKQRKALGILKEALQWCHDQCGYASPWQTRRRQIGNALAQCAAIMKCDEVVEEGKE